MLQINPRHIPIHELILVLAALKFMNKNKMLSGGEKNLTGGGKWGWRGREVGGEGEGRGVKGEGKWGLGTPLSTPSYIQNTQQQLIKMAAIIGLTFLCIGPGSHYCKENALHVNHSYVNMSTCRPVDL